MKTVFAVAVLSVFAASSGCACYMTSHEIGFKRLLGVDIAAHPTGMGSQTTAILPATQVQQLVPALPVPPVMMPQSKMVIMDCNSCRPVESASGPCNSPVKNSTLEFLLQCKQLSKTILTQSTPRRRENHKKLEEYHQHNACKGRFQHFLLVFLTASLCVFGGWHAFARPIVPKR